MGDLDALLAEQIAYCPGTWTSELLQYADRVTAADASREMLEPAAAKENRPVDMFIDVIELVVENWPVITHVPRMS